MQILSKAVGIDLGTTNSVVALMNPSDTDIILHKDKNKSSTTPSCIWRNPKDGQIEVGLRAFSRRGAYPPPIRSIKRLMGQNITVDVTGKKMTPPEVSAEILKEMKRQIEEDAAQLSDRNNRWVVDRAIVTIPAYFDQPQSQATLEAARLAGFDVLELLHEPTAAACYYCWKSNIRNGIFMVYDLGGGTFDVTILKATAGSFEEIGLSGDTMLGGDDMDTAIAERLLERIKEDYALNLDLTDPEDQLRMDMLRFISEGVKKELSTRTEFNLRSSSLQDKEGRTVVIDTFVERSELESWIRPVIARTLPKCAEALAMAHKKAGITLANIDAIILAGGSTHIPLVRQIVKETFCADPNSKDPRAKCAEPVYGDVDNIVGLGAAISASAAGGLTICDARKTVRITFFGTSVSRSKEAHIAGKVEALAGQSLEGARICVSAEDQDYRDDALIAPDGQFVLEDVPLEKGINQLTFEIQDNSGNIIVSTSRSWTQDNLARESCQPTPTLPKAISLEVRESNKIVRKPLLPELQSLPVTVHHKFLHPGNTDKVLFKLFQRRALIKKITVPVSAKLAKGTSIDLSISVDKYAFIFIQGSIGDTPFDVKVDPPAERAMPAPEEVNALASQFEENLQYLVEGEQMVLKARFAKARAAFENELQRQDRACAVHQFEEMEEIAAGIYREKVVLYPAKPFFDKDIQETEEIIEEASQILKEVKKPADAAKWRGDLKLQEEAGAKAYKELNQPALAEAMRMIENLGFHIIGCVRPYIDKPKISPAQQARWRVRTAKKENDKIEHHAKAKERADIVAELEQIRGKLKELEDQTERNPDDVISKSDDILERLKQIREVLAMPPDKTEDGQLPEQYK
jgi:molecular chaperone DnaK